MISDMYYCDFILSIGPHCRPAVNLRLNQLREFSSPLDWMMDYSLDTVLHLFRSGFRDFFTEYELDSAEPDGAAGMLRVNDTLNGIVSIHHFPADIPPDSAYPQFDAKMRKRARRLESMLHNASSVVLLSDRTESEHELSSFLYSFSDIYPHLRIRLINTRHDENMPFDSYRQETVFADGKLSYIEYHFNDTEHGAERVSGNKFIWEKILSAYHIAQAVCAD